MTRSDTGPGRYRVTRAGKFTAERAWGATDIADVFYTGVGCEQVAHSQGAARILVVETKGSV